MSGTESAHANAASNGGGGGFDLLKRATQAMMMSRSTAAEDDGADQIGYDTPRSGIATPKPDLHDKRLPGIMTYFTQVGAESPCNTGSLTTPPEEKAVQISPESGEKNGRKDTAMSGVAGADGHAGAGAGAAAAAATGPSPNSHTVPAHHPAEDGSVLVFRPVPAGDQVRSGGETAGPPADPAEGVASGSADSDTDPVEPTDGSPMSSTRPSSVNSEHDPAAAGPKTWFSFGMLKKLTTATLYKSGACTPTRALSTTHPSRADDNGLAPVRGNSNESATPSRSQTPRPTPAAAAAAGAPAGAHVPLTKGKLTIKIVEARGLKKSNAPYVVVVFQRNELISDSPHSFEEEEEDTTNLATPGQTLIQRQGSDSGRPPMAIPMRSRQSSNTSIHDYSTIRNRPTQTSFTNPKWDAEAVFDVMDSDMRVDISIYDQGPAQTQAQSQSQSQSQQQTSQSGGGTSITCAPASGSQPSGEAILGNVHFRMSIDKDTPIQGWFPLRGHVNTEADDAPTGEIYVEASYQRTEKKHFGPEDFQILRLIGKGTFGQVYQVRKKDTQRIYAMKVLSKKVIVQKKEVAHTVGERNILVRTATSDSPFIVGLKYSFQTPSDLYLVTDFLSGGELFWHLQKEGRFDETRAKFYIAELILAIQHLHDNDIVYRDLKPENILLDANGHIALCDFGLSKANLTKNDTTNTFCGTTEYLAPEVLLDESGYSKMVDFWSLGVLVFEMCCGWSPFYAEDTQQMYKNIAFGKVRFPRETLSQDGRNFVKGLLNRNPKHRLGAIKDAEELKNHAFFADIDWDLLSRKLITPPFKPKLKSETDVSYFDPEFTNALDNNGSLNERAAALAGGFATSTPLSPSMQANFQGFTFVDESALEDHMKDRGQSDDEEMNDGNNHGANHDDDWDSLDDMHPHGANRMSGIVRTATNEDQMFGETQFDD